MKPINELTFDNPDENEIDAIRSIAEGWAGGGDDELNEAGDDWVAAMNKDASIVKAFKKWRQLADTLHEKLSTADDMVRPNVGGISSFQDDALRIVRYGDKDYFVDKLGNVRINLKEAVTAFKQFEAQSKILMNGLIQFERRMSGGD